MFENFKVRLPFGKEKEVAICTICGQTLSNSISAEAHENKCEAPVQEEPDVAIGDVVEITTSKGFHSPVWIREQWCVTDLFYSGDFVFLLPRGTKTTREPHPHTLCIELAQNFNHQAYDPEAEDKSCSFFSTTYEEFKILRRGNIQELEEIGVLKKKSVFWSKLFDRN